MGASAGAGAGADAESALCVRAVLKIRQQMDVAVRAESG